MSGLTGRIRRVFLSRNYWLYKRLRYREFRSALESGKKPLVIYQMGKVGSSTIVNSLQRLPVDYHIHQVHVLTHDWIEKVHRQYMHASAVQGRPIIEPHILSSMYVREKLDCPAPADKWKVISLVRDPIARNISCFFQAFHIYFPEYGKHLEDGGLDTGTLLKVFHEKFQEHETPLIWFETHMEPVFGIDVYAEPFAKEKGFRIYRNDHAELLVLRMEDIDLCAREAFREFLGIEDFVVAPKNITGNKGYSSLYGKFKEEVVISHEMLDHMYASRYMRHFYTEKEIQAFRRRWSDDRGEG